MPFITRTEIDNVYGTENVTRWSQLDPDLTTADTTRITAAIDYAEDWVQTRLRGSRYAVPFGSVDGVVSDWLAKLAGDWLYNARKMRDGDTTELPSVHVERTEKAIDAALAGAVLLDMPLARGRQPTIPSVPGG